MKRLFPLLLAFFLMSCQSQQATPPVATVFVVDGEKVYTLGANSVSPAVLAARAGLIFSPSARFLLNGQIAPAELTLPTTESYTLQIVRAVNVTLIAPDGETRFETTAPTVGAALNEIGLQLYAQDLIAPPPETPLTVDITVTYQPARDYVVQVDNQSITVKSAAQSVGQVLASVGIPLIGLDYSHPGESDPAPADGQIEIVRVQEAITLVQKSIPFSTKYEYSTELPLGSENILKPGETGLSVSTVRVRLENGVEVARTTEEEVLVREPVDQVMGRGTQVTLETLPDGQAQYWRVVQMWATSYSPCRSGTEKCSYGTASGMQVQRGVVAMTRDLYYALGGSQVYIPGYGTAVIADVGGGFPDGRLWIDLGYSDDDWQNWGGWVTVYFLAPAPATIPAALQ